MKKKILLAKIKVCEDHWLRLSEELDALKSTFLPIVEAVNKPKLSTSREEFIREINKPAVPFWETTNIDYQQIWNDIVEVGRDILKHPDIESMSILEYSRRLQQQLFKKWQVSDGTR